MFRTKGLHNCEIWTSHPQISITVQLSFRFPKLARKRIMPNHSRPAQQLMALSESTKAQPNHTESLRQSVFRLTAEATSLATAVDHHATPWQLAYHCVRQLILAFQNLVTVLCSIMPSLSGTLALALFLDACSAAMLVLENVLCVPSTLAPPSILQRRSESLQATVVAQFRCANRQPCGMGSSDSQMDGRS